LKGMVAVVPCTSKDRGAGSLRLLPGIQPKKPDYHQNL
jgi:hypothetical protein